MKKKIVILSITILVVAALIFLFIFWKNSKGRQTTLTIFGNVDIREVNLGFRVPGRVNALFFEEGDRVLEGQKLSTLDPEIYKEEIWRAKAEMDAIEASLENAELKLTRRDHVSKEALSVENHEDALYNKKILEENLKSAKASLEVALTNYKDTKIKAPANGTILSRIREPGTIVQFGEPVYTLSLEDPVWVRTYVTEPNLGKIYPGMRAEIFTDTATNPVYHGQIGFISPVAEFTPKNVETQELRTDLVYRLRVIVDNHDRGLRQGMPVTVKLKLEPNAGTQP